jgi:hypothetical protein
LLSKIYRSFSLLSAVNFSISTIFPVIDFQFTRIYWIKAPFGGPGTGANPTDRGKKGTKRSILTEGKRIPLSVTIDGANRHDKKFVSVCMGNI